MLRLIKAWLRAPIVEEDYDSGRRKVLPNHCGTPQGGVISPIFANLYLNDLDHAVNEKCVPDDIQTSTSATVKNRHKSR